MSLLDQFGSFLGKTVLPSVGSTLSQAGRGLDGIGQAYRQVVAHNPVQQFTQQAVAPVVQRIATTPLNLGPQNRESLAQRFGRVTTDVRRNPDTYNLFAQMARMRSGAAPVDAVVNTAGQFANNRIAQPLLHLGAGALHTLDHTAAPLDRLGGATDAVFGGLSLTPGGLGFTTGRDAVVNTVRSLRTGANPLTGAIRGTTGQETSGLGDALTDNPTLAAVGNVAETPLLFAHGTLKGRVGTQSAFYRAPHADDAKFLDEAVTVLRTEKNNGKARIAATADIDRLLNDYVKERLPAKEFQKLANAHIDKKIGTLQDFFRTADDFTSPRMGITAQRPRHHARRHRPPYSREPEPDLW